MKKLPQRKSPRLKGYDYSSSGCYFITICTKNREYLFGDIVEGLMLLNDCGKITKNVWEDLKNHNTDIQSDVHCIMPNHVHGIIEIVGNGSKPFRGNKKYHHGIPEIVRQFKSFSSRYINDFRKRNGLEPFPTGGIWQKSYHDHIIRNEESYLKIYEYIQNNPMQWELDCHNSVNPKYKEWNDD